MNIATFGFLANDIADSIWTEIGLEITNALSHLAKSNDSIYLLLDL